MSSVNQSQAKSIAQSSVDAVRGTYNSSFVGMYGVFGQNPDCSPFNKVVKLGYSLLNASGVQQVVTVTKNPTVTSVINTTVQAPVYLGTTFGQCCWAGYNYDDPAWMRKAGANWNEPSATEAWHGQCDLANCDYYFWVGLTQQGNGGSGIVQTGTDSGISCAFGSCTLYHYAWFENFPQPSYKCFGISFGDQMTESVYLNGRDRYGYLHYATYIKDNSNGQSCSTVFPEGSSWYTMYAQLMGERPNDHLPKFSPTVSVTGGYYVNDGGSTVSIDSNWSQQYIMNNNVNTAYSCNGQNSYQNICNGAVASGAFTETWDTSVGT